MNSTTQTKETVQAGSQELERTEELVAQVFFGATAIGTLSIGAWAVACMIGGMISAGGPLSFVFSWFKAVNGI
ncbi:MAG: hypothetical protein ABFS19_02310 [Thermodesulfobacteriota bacterium]